MVWVEEGHMAPFNLKGEDGNEPSETYCLCITSYEVKWKLRCTVRKRSPWAVQISAVD